MNAPLKWGDPPKGITTREANNAIAAQLRSRPGEWALIRVYDEDQRHLAYGYAQSIRDGRTVAFRTGTFEAVGRRISDSKGRSGVWARFVGEEDS